MASLIPSPSLYNRQKTTEMHFDRLVTWCSLRVQLAVEFDFGGNMRQQEAVSVCGDGAGQKSHMEWRLSGSN